MGLALDIYEVEGADRLITPALLIYPELVDANIDATLNMAGNDPERWRPHIKTTKIGAMIRRLMDHGVRNFKCSTTLELLTACEAQAEDEPALLSEAKSHLDVLLAYSVTGANARRALQIAEQFPRTRISVLVETAEQAATWRGTNIGIFLDINSGMNRTGIDQERVADIVKLAREVGGQFRGIHYYDGHMSGIPASEREARAHQGYDQVREIIRALQEANVQVGEVITSGTPAAPFAISYSGFRDRSFVHRISPGTVVYNDTTSLEQLPEYGYRPAAIVLSTVVSHPTQSSFTCDAGHKSVSADAGVPTCSVIGHPDFKPLKPSEEHLPIEASGLADMPKIGQKLYLVPRHVCPTVNNFDEALIVVGGRIAGVEPVNARGHESPLRITDRKITV